MRLLVINEALCAFGFGNKNRFRVKFQKCSSLYIYLTVYDIWYNKSY